MVEDPVAGADANLTSLAPASMIFEHGIRRSDSVEQRQDWCLPAQLPHFVYITNFNQ